MLCIGCFLFSVFLQYPEGYLEAVANKDKEKENNGDDEFDTAGKGKRKRKSAGLWSRQVDRESLVGFCAFYLVTLFWLLFVWLSKKLLCFLLGGEEKLRTSPVGTPKKTKVEPYKLTAQQKSLIKNDEANEKLWNGVLEALKDGPVYHGVLFLSPPKTDNQLLYLDTNLLAALKKQLQTQSGLWGCIFQRW